MEQPVLKSDGNKQQFQHELKVLEKLEDAKWALEQKKDETYSHETYSHCR